MTDEAQVREIAALMANPQRRVMFYLDTAPPPQVPNVVDARRRDAEQAGDDAA